MKTYFTSDLHFSHKRIVEFTNRSKETSQEDHDSWLTELWNNTVENQDKVFHLGDFSFGTTYEQVAKQVQRLKGQKFFIKGNHDRSKFLDQLKKDRLIQDWYEYKEIMLSDNHACLFHFPIASWHKQNYGSLMLHGHSHGAFTGGKGKILDVGIDSAYNIKGKHSFFSEVEVQEYMQQKEIYVADHHRTAKETQ